MRHARASYAPKQRTIADIHAELVSLLYQCRPAALASLTADDLCRRYSRLRPDVVRAEFDAALRARAGEMRSA